MLCLWSQIRRGINAASLCTLGWLVLVSVARVEGGHAVDHTTRLLTASCAPLRWRLALGRSLERKRDRRLGAVLLDVRTCVLHDLLMDHKELVIVALSVVLVAREPLRRRRRLRGLWPLTGSARPLQKHRRVATIAAIGEAVANSIVIALRTCRDQVLLDQVQLVLLLVREHLLEATNALRLLAQVIWIVVQAHTVHSCLLSGKVAAILLEQVVGGLHERHGPASSCEAR